MAYVILTIIVILGFVDIKNKHMNRGILLLIAGYMWVLVGLNTATPDYYAYESMYINYNTPAYSLHEPGFLLLCGIGNLFGMTYQQFRMLEASILVVISIATIKKASVKVNTVLVLYLLTTYIGFASGLRQALGSSISAFCICYLFENNKRVNIKFVVGILIATMFHYSSLFYLIFLFAKRKRIRMSSMFILIAVELLAFEIVKRNILYNILITFIKSNKVANWFNYSGVKHPSFLAVGFFVAIQSMMIYLIIKAVKSIKNSNKNVMSYNEKCYWEKEENLNKIININYMMLLIIPGYLINSNFLRLVLGIIILNYSVIEHSIGLKNMKLRVMTTTNKNIIIQCATFIIALLYFALNSVVNEMVLNCNRLFSLLTLWI